MLGTFKWLFRLTVGIIILALLSIGLAYYLAIQSLPNYNKAIAVNGLQEQIEIVRDHTNVPHIFGVHDEDVFFGLGYAHAQDRLWQMTILRRTIQGRLSEVFGPRTQNVDAIMRQYGLYQQALDSVDDQDNYTQAALTAYAAGVNARLDEIQQNSLGRGAPEMFLFHAPIKLWQPADSLAIIKLMGIHLSAHLSAEILRTQVALEL